jgi:hypothetical protein
MPRLTVLALLIATFTALCSDAQAADDPFTVSGIPVDATAASATVAETMAINSGRQRAWTMVYRHLTKAQDWPHQPVLDDTTLQRLIRSYLPVNERRSTTRYVASMTYVFNPDAVRRLFRQNNIAYADMQAKPILIIPMSPGYQARAGWTTAWANSHYSGGAVPLVLPMGDAVDASALGALKFGTSAWQDVEPIASRVHAEEAWLVLGEPTSAGYVVKLRRLGPGTSPPIPDVVVPIPPKTAPAKVFASAADAVANAIIDAWKARAAVDYNKRSKLIAEVRIDSLGAWSALLQKLGTVPTIADVGVVAMNTGEARIAISYVGTSDQLTLTLTQAGFDLSNDDGVWWLAPQTAAASTTPESQ